MAEKLTEESVKREIAKILEETKLKGKGIAEETMKVLFDEIGKITSNVQSLTDSLGNIKNLNTDKILKKLKDGIEKNQAAKNLPVKNDDPFYTYLTFFAAFLFVLGVFGKNFVIPYLERSLSFSNF